MAWHIFKKDWALLWPIVILIWLLPGLEDIVFYQTSNLEFGSQWNQITEWLRPVGIIGIAVLSILVVQTDAIPSDRQDWLTRPIRRRDLLASKILFLLLTVPGPIIVADISLSIAEGFPFGKIISGVVPQDLEFTLGYALIGAIIGIVTKNLVEAVIAALVLFVELVVLNTAQNSFGPQWGAITFPDGAGVIATAIIVVPIVGSAALICYLQYFRRATAFSRVFLLSAVFLLFILGIVGALLSFPLREHFSSDQVATNSISLAFNPGDEHSERLAKSFDTSSQRINIPLHVSNLSADSLLISEKCDVRFIESNGQTALSSKLRCSLFRPENDVDQRRQNTPGPWDPSGTLGVSGQAEGDGRVLQSFDIPASIFDRIKDGHWRMEIDEALTLFERDGTKSILDQAPMAYRSPAAISPFGKCRLSDDPELMGVEVMCRAIQDDDPNCYRIIAENTSTKAQITNGSRCVMRGNSFSGFVRHDGNEHGPRLIFSSFYGWVWYRNASGEDGVRSGGQHAGDWRIAIETYKPRAYLTRHLVIPEIRLADWATTPE